MPSWVLVAVNSIAAGVVAGSGTFLGIAYALPKGDSFDAVMWGIVICTALGAAAKDWLSYMQVPPSTVVKATFALLLMVLTS